jgi:tetratricopeptide (TPR) repeat protein
MTKKSFAPEKSIVAAFIFILFLSPATFAKEIPDSAYKSAFEAAIKIFDADGFEKAYEEFYKLYQLKTDDKKVNFYLGRCALELKKYDEAIAAFDRVLIVEPTHARGHLEMARAYFEQKEFGMAEAEFDEALKANLPKQVKEQVAGYKKAIEESKQKHFINGFLSASIGYDSNINNGIGTKDYSVPSFGISIAGEPPKEDYYHSETAGINHIYDMKDIKVGMFWQDSLTLYAQSYRNAITNNSRYIGISTGPAYRTNEYEAAVSLTADKLIYGGLDYMYTKSLQILLQ